MSPHEHGPHPQPRPAEFFPSWRERLLNWSGWETIAHHRGQVLLGTLLVIGVFGTLIWLMSRRESASVMQVVQAEALVQELQAPGSQPDYAGQTAAHEFEQLKTMASPGSALERRFAGVLAQEEVLQGTSPLSTAYFGTAEDTLFQAVLTHYADLVRATELTEQGSLDEALAVIEKTRHTTSVDTNPVLDIYLLMQKATILHMQGKSTAAVVEELQQHMDTSPKARAAFDHWSGGKADDILAFLRS